VTRLAKRPVLQPELHQLEGNGVHHGPRQASRGRANKYADDEAEGASQLEAGRQVRPEERVERQEREVGRDDVIGKPVRVVELVQAVVDHQRSRHHAQEQHAQVGERREQRVLEDAEDRMVVLLQELQAREVRLQGEPSGARKHDARRDGEERQGRLKGVGGAVTRLAKRPVLQPELHQLEGNGVHHGPRQASRGRANKYADDEAEGASQLEAGRQVRPEERVERQEREVGRDDVIGKPVRVVELVQAVVDHQRSRHHAQEEHAHVLEQRIIQPVDHQKVEERVGARQARTGPGVHQVGLLRRRQDRAREQVGEGIGKPPEEDADGALSGGLDLRPLEGPLDHGHEPATKNEPVEPENGVVLAQREAEDLGRPVGARDADRVLEQRIGVQVVQNVVRDQVRVDLRRVAQLELLARVRHHIADAVHVRVALDLEEVVDLDRLAEPLARERRLLEHARVRHHAHALVDDIGVDLLARLELDVRLLDLVDRLAEHQLHAGPLQPGERVL